jgi:predicted acetyltransferase
MCRFLLQEEESDNIWLIRTDSMFQKVSLGISSKEAVDQLFSNQKKSKSALVVRFTE